ncbi:MAG: hypothetical protein Q9197_007070, partial [Variospora fuerteventurae]
DRGRLGRRIRRNSRVSPTSFPPNLTPTEKINFPPGSAFVMSPSPPSTFPGAFLRLRQPIAYCNGTTYAFSLYARQLPPSTLTCRLAFFTDFEGTIADFEPLAGEWTRYGPVTRAPFRDNGVRNAKGEWEDRLDVLVQCLGVEGVEGVRTAVEVDGVRVLPV